MIPMDRIVKIQVEPAPRENAAPGLWINCNLMKFPKNGCATPSSRFARAQALVRRSRPRAAMATRATNQKNDLFFVWRGFSWDDGGLTGLSRIDQQLSPWGYAQTAGPKLPPVPSRPPSGCPHHRRSRPPTEMYTWGRNVPLGSLPQPHPSSPRIHFALGAGCQTISSRWVVLCLLLRLVPAPPVSQGSELRLTERVWLA